MPTTTASEIRLNETKTVATYFRGERRFGRTTTLVHKVTGETLTEVMGNASRSDCFRAFRKQQGL